MNKKLGFESLGRRDLLTANALINFDGSVEIKFDEPAVVDEVFVDAGFTGPCYIDSHVAFGENVGGFTVEEASNRDITLFMSDPAPVSVGQVWSPPFGFDCDDVGPDQATNIHMEVRYADGKFDFVEVEFARPIEVSGHINIDGSIQLNFSRDVHVRELNLRTLDDTLGVSNYEEQGFALDGSAHPSNIIVRSWEPTGVEVFRNWMPPITYTGPLDLMVFGGVAGEITFATGEVVEFNVELGPDVPIGPIEVDRCLSGEAEPVAAVYPSGLVAISDAHCFPLRGIELISADSGLHPLAPHEFLDFEFHLANEPNHIAVGSLVDVTIPPFFPVGAYHSAFEDLQVLIGVTQQPPMEIPVVFAPDPTDPRFDPPPFDLPELAPVQPPVDSPVEPPVEPPIELPVDPPEAINPLQGARLYVAHDGTLSFTLPVDVTGYSLWSESGRFTVERESTGRCGSVRPRRLCSVGGESR